MLRGRTPRRQTGWCQACVGDLDTREHGADGGKDRHETGSATQTSRASSGHHKPTRVSLGADGTDPAPAATTTVRTRSRLILHNLYPEGAAALGLTIPRLVTNAGGSGQSNLEPVSGT